MQEYPEHLILKSLHGTLSGEEARELDAWLRNHEDNRKILEEMQQAWQLSKPKTKNLDFNTAHELVKLEEALNKEKDVRVRSIIPQYWLKVAASVSILMASSFILYQVVFKNEEIVKQTSSNTLQVTLPDGSDVWLNSESQLTYLDNFNNERTIELQGEAFFNVEENPDKPFIVRTNQSEVKVLGTSFNVKDYQDSITEVFVATGLVNFANEQNISIALKPGETGVLNKKDNRITLSSNEDLNVLAWKEKRLVFRKTKLNEVVKTLRNYFRIDIKIANKDLLNCRFTSSFQEPKIEEVIEALSVSLNMNVSNENNIYTFDGTGCK